MIEIRPVSPENPDVSQLIAFHLSGMIENSPKGSIHALGHSGLISPEITMFGAFEAGECLSIGAVKTLNKTEGEVKSMRTHPKALGRGLGTMILRHIIAESKARSWNKLSLETGTGPSFDAAHHIYKTHGFVPCEAFGDYEATDFNRFFSLAL